MPVVRTAAAAPAEAIETAKLGRVRVVAMGCSLVRVTGSDWP